MANAVYLCLPVCQSLTSERGARTSGRTGRPRSGAYPGRRDPAGRPARTSGSDVRSGVRGPDTTAAYRFMQIVLHIVFYVICAPSVDHEMRVVLCTAISIMSLRGRSMCTALGGLGGVWQRGLPVPACLPIVDIRAWRSDVRPDRTSEIRCISGTARSGRTSGSDVRLGRPVGRPRA